MEMAVGQVSVPGTSIQYSAGPLVTVITPFFNSAGTLERCIRSVLSQSFSDFEYLLCDNSSDDGSDEICRRYAAKDARIRFLRFDEHVSQSANYNRALRQISPMTHYCKIVQADDHMLQGGLAALVAVARKWPTAGLISAVREIDGDPDPADPRPIAEFIDGREIARRTLLGGPYLFGSPTTVMYRADLVRSRPQFYPEDAFFDDNDAALALLSVSDFAFSQHVATNTTRDPQSTLGRVITFDISLLYRYLAIRSTGADFFSQTQLPVIREQLTREYHATLLRALLCRKDRREYLHFHRRVLVPAKQWPTAAEFSRTLAGIAAKRIARLAARMCPIRSLADQRIARRSWQRSVE